jgi:signal transduction histidine kinase
LTNLLSNAIRFSPSGGGVTVAADPADDVVRFTVVDQGRGIPADNLDKVFDRFQQVDASDAREKDGTGLGLYICRGIVEQHGGSIRAASIGKGGSTFTFTLPIALSSGAHGDLPQKSGEAWGQSPSDSTAGNWSEYASVKV